jgi:2-C-methyl-D-erythritol 2,4-cyclodiphosphate synthase
VIGGVRIESERGVIAHSDGDCLLHAITDAMLGALGLPDIGELFPSDDAAWAGADSAMLAQHAAKLLAQRGWEIANIDATVSLESPKLASQKGAIKAGVAKAFAVHPDKVNVKGKTREGVDAVGEGRAIEAHAVVMISQGFEATRNKDR